MSHLKGSKNLVYRYTGNERGERLMQPQTDFVLLPCDLAPPKSLKLTSVLDKHRQSPDAVLTSVFYEPVEPVKEGKHNQL